MENSNNLKWMCFSGLAQDYASWSTRFTAFLQTKSLFDTLMGTETVPQRPERLGENPNDEDRNRHARETQAYTDKLNDIEQRNNTVWCYLAMALDSTSLMLLRHDCVNLRGKGDGHKAWTLLQRRFRSDERTTVVSLMRQLSKLQLKEDEALHEYFIRAQELCSRIAESGENLSETLFNAMVLNGLPPRYEHFVVQESFNPATTFVELRTRLTNYEESRAQRHEGEEAQHIAMTAKRFRPKTQKTSHTGKGAESKQKASLGPCFCCGLEGHLARDCKKKEVTECYKCKKKGHIAKYCKAPNGSTSQSPTCLKADSLSSTSISDFVIDSGSTDHIVVERSWFQTYTKIENSVTNPDGGVTKVEGKGDVAIRATDTKGNSISLILQDALHVPGYRTNLVSVANMTRKGHEVLHTVDSSLLKLTNGSKFLLKQKGKLFFLSCTPETVEFSANYSSKTAESELWHKRLGHLNYRDVGLTANVKTMDVETPCEVCSLGKISKKPVSKLSDNRAKQTLERVHSDVLGPVNPSSINGFRYAVTFVDDFSRYANVKFLRYKSEVLEMFKEYIAEHGVPQILRSDNGTEYTSKDFRRLCVENKIKQEFTVPETPEQNGLAERFNRTVVEMARCMLIESGLPKSYWVRALDTAAQVRNIVVKENNGKSPFEMFWLRKPKMHNLKVFGCLAYVKNRKTSQSKFDPKAKKHVFIGYDRNSPGFLLQSIESRKTIVARNVIFDESKIPGLGDELQEISDDDFLCDLETIEEVSEDDRTKVPLLDPATKKSSDKQEVQEQNTGLAQPHETLPKSASIPKKPKKSVTFAGTKHVRYYRDSESQGTSEGQNPNNQLRKSDRKRSPPVRLNEVYTHNSELIDVPPEPLTYREAISSDDKNHWIDAMNKEIESLKDSDTWQLVEVSDDKNIVPGKWVYKVKTGANGEIEKYKARYVAKGFKQIEGLEYFETFAPTSKPETFRILLAIAAKQNFTLRQLDVKSAYLHPKIDEEVYLEQPEGYVQVSSTGKPLVCKLKKSIYGLKQAARNWYQELANFLKSENFERSKNDYCLFYKVSTSKTKLYILSWVDDLVIAGNDSTEIEELKSAFESKFKMDDRGELKWFLGMRIERKVDGITLDQELYAANILRRFGMDDCKPSKTPAETNLKLQAGVENAERCDPHLYRSLVGSLLFLAKQTRPDIMWIVNVLSRFMNSPTSAHWAAGKRVLRYLQHSKTLRLTYPSNTNLKLIGETDADWSGDVNDRRSTTGYYFKLGFSGGAISWQVRKQTTVSLSSCEAEYQGLSCAVQEAVFLRNLLEEIGYKQTEATEIGEDNQSCIKIATNPVMHKRSKHIDTKCHFIRERIEDKSVQLKYTPTDMMAADLLTKSLSLPKVEQHRRIILGEQISPSNVGKI